MRSRYPRPLKTYKVYIESRSLTDDRVIKKHVIRAEDEEDCMTVIINRFGIGKTPTIHIREKV